MSNSETIRWYFTKKFWGALLISIALWIYASLNEEYRTLIDVPLAINPPKNRAVEAIFPENINKIQVDVKGNGWYLFNYLYLNKMKKCNVNLDDVRKTDSFYIVSAVDLQRGLTNINRIEPQRFYPGQINVKTGEIGSKEVNILPDIDIELDDGFVLVGNLKTEPQSITITGNSSLIDSIKQWKTRKTQLSKINSSLSFRVPVSDSLNSMIKIKPNYITVFATVQQYGEITFDDVELQIIGGKIPAEHSVLPKYFSVTLTGGIDLLNKISVSDISLTIDYETLLKDKTGLLKPTITVPPFTKLLSISPKYLQHNINIKYKS